MIAGNNLTWYCIDEVTALNVGAEWSHTKTQRPHIASATFSCIKSDNHCTEPEQTDLEEGAGDGDEEGGRRPDDVGAVVARRGV
jgi:hypothetical protein